MTLTKLTKQMISKNVFTIIYLASEGCPGIDLAISIYTDLEDFAYSINNATDEEKQYVQESINIFMPSLYNHHTKDFPTFRDCLVYFFNDEHIDKLDTFLFGKMLLAGIEKVKEENGYE